MINGVVTVLVTPLRSDGSICEDSLGKIIDYQLKRGIAAFWALGSTGEDISLSKKTRMEFVEIIADKVNKKVPIIMGTGEFSIEDNIAFYKHCFNQKIDYVSYIHRDTKQDSSKFVDSVIKIEERTPLPIFLYNNVQRGKEIDYNSLKILSKLKNIKGVKYGARMHMPFIRAASLNANDFQVFSAGNFFFSAMCYGLKASTTSDANFMPNVYTKIKSLVEEGNISEARKIQFAAIEILKGIPRTNNGESSAEIKYILFLMGLCTEYVNPSYRILTKEEKTKVEKIYNSIQNFDKSFYK